MTHNHKLLLGATWIGLVLILLYVYVPDGVLMEPHTQPHEYLAQKPYVRVGDWVVIVPSSTILVYLLGIEILWIGIWLMRRRQTLWGAALLFWGVGTLLAGTSYQGLGYELRCAGLEFCRFTSWFETSYLFVTAISISLLAMAFSKDFLAGLPQQLLDGYAKGALVIYTILLLFGSILDVRFLITYELFTVFFMPLFVVFFLINVRQYRAKQDENNRRFILLWILFLVVNVAYYAYYLPGVTTSLYEATDIWFSANDVLHVGLMLWFGYLYHMFRVREVATQ